MMTDTTLLPPCEANPLPHRTPCACAPSLQDIVDWFRGRRLAGLSTEALGRLMRDELERLLAGPRSPTRLDVVLRLDGLAPWDKDLSRPPSDCPPTRLEVVDALRIHAAELLAKALRLDPLPGGALLSDHLRVVFLDPEVVIALRRWLVAAHHQEGK